MKIEDFRATTNANTTGDQNTQCNSAPLLDVGRGNEPLKSEILEAISRRSSTAADLSAALMLLNWKPLWPKFHKPSLPLAALRAATQSCWR